MAKKKILVKDILNLLNDEQEACVVLYAYGMHYGSTHRDGMKTVAEIKEKLMYDGMNALVCRIDDDFNDKTKMLMIRAEIVHD